MVVCLAGLGDFPDRLRIRHANPLAIADVPGRKDEESLKATCDGPGGLDSFRGE